MALVLARHLLHDDFGVRINMKPPRIQRKGTLQCFHQGHVFSDIAILVSDPLCNSDWTGSGAINNYSNPGRPRISERATVDMRNEIKHKV